uniref:Uncharacterized protein n=1 Tax=Lepeophtheirus salmonis TaxID=72036 RepID=A0A0K2TWI0_LEPSM
MLPRLWISVCMRKYPNNIKNAKICDSILYPIILSGILRLNLLK